MSAERWIGGIALVAVAVVGLLLLLGLNALQLVMLIVGGVAAFAWSEARHVDGGGRR